MSHSTNIPRTAPQKLRVRARGSSAQDTHLPDAGLLPVHHRHAAHFVGLDELPLRLVELLRHEAHEGVVGGVSCGHQEEKICGWTRCFLRPHQGCGYGPVAAWGPRGAQFQSLAGALRKNGMNSKQVVHKIQVLELA